MTDIRGPGRPSTGTAISTRIDDATLAEVDKIAAATGQTRAETIRRLLVHALSVEHAATVAKAAASLASTTGYSIGAASAVKRLRYALERPIRRPAGAAVLDLLPLTEAQPRSHRSPRLGQRELFSARADEFAERHGLPLGSLVLMGGHLAAELYAFLRLLRMPKRDTRP